MVRKILFLPLLKMNSGHHQTAESLMYSFEKVYPHIHCKKVEFLSYVNQRVEAIITRTYLKWIDKAPRSYSRFYKKLFHTGSSKKSLFKLYESLFLEQMEQLIIEEKPDIIICTHGFPSYLVSRLKLYGVCNIPTVNVYTDFFVNDLWGKIGIDLHFVPSFEVKQQLINRDSIDHNCVMVSGIIRDERITITTRQTRPTTASHLLIAGGSQGVGRIMPYLPKHDQRTMTYTVLCGNNKKLHDNIVSLNNPCVRPLPYISKRENINLLYDSVDAIITKPGGVTISEAIAKRIPIFIHSTLPGQEEVNLNYLNQKGLIQILQSDISPMKQITETLQNKTFHIRYNQSVDHFLNEEEFLSTSDIVKQITLKASKCSNEWKQNSNLPIKYSVN